MNRHRKTSGFTLVELLVVIGIIALLIAILLPSLQRARASAVSVACLSNQRQIGLGLVQYANDHDLYLPAAFGDDPDNNFPGRDPKWHAYVVLAQYANGGSIGYSGVYTCGADQQPLLVGNDYYWNSGFDPARDSSGAVAPEAQVELSYAYNAGWDREHAYRKLSSIRNATEVRAVGDTGQGNRHNGTFNFENQGNFESHFPFNRHDGKVNFAFFDGHAESVEGSEDVTGQLNDEYVFIPFWSQESNAFSRAWDHSYIFSTVARP